MSDDVPSSDPAEPADAAEPVGEEEPAREPEWRRRARLAAVFGDVLPETTNDERDEAASGSSAATEAQDRWLRSQVPPHHG